MSNAEQLSCCGLSCSICAIYQAHTTNDLKLKKLAYVIYKKSLTGSKLSHLSIEDIKCEGCHSDIRFKYCQICDIRSCNSERTHFLCYQCSEYPCSKILNFPVPTALNEMLKAGAKLKKKSPLEYIQEVILQHTCSKCGTLLFRGSNRCPKCRSKYLNE